MLNKLLAILAFAIFFLFFLPAAPHAQCVGGIASCPPAGVLDGDDVFYVIEDGNSRNITRDNLKTALNAGVSTFAGRTGAVTPTGGDYSIADLTVTWGDGLDVSGTTVSLDIAELTEDASPATGDFVAVEDAAVPGQFRKVQVGNLPGGGGGINNVVEDTTPQLGGQLDVNGFGFGDGILELLTFTEDASAVNHLNIENQATGTAPILRSAGDDASVDLQIECKGTCTVDFADSIDVTGNIVVSGTVDGRDVATDGTKLDGVEALADVTDATNVAAAGAVMDSDISAAEGFLRKTGAGAYEAVKSNLTATTDPGATDDSSAGYAVGSLWINVTADKSFVAVDVSVSAAVWKETSAGAGGGITAVVDDTTPQLGGQLDVNGQALGDGTLELVTFTETASAVNQVNITNNTTGNAPVLGTAGDDTNIDLNIDPKGTGAITLTGTVSATGSIQAGTSIGTFIAPAGSVSAPSYSFTTDSDTGLYHIGANQVGLATLGILRFSATAAEVSSTLPILNALGSAAAPAYSFTGDPNTGVYSAGADQINFATGGTLRSSISTTATTHTLPIRAAAGTAAAPTYSLSADTNTGVYSAGADQLNWSTGGTLRLSLSNTALTPAVAVAMADNNLTRPNIVDYAVESTAPAISAGTLTLDLTNGNDFDVTLNANVTTITVSNWCPTGTLCKFSLALTQDATGSRTVAFPAGWDWAGGTAPTMTAAANSHDEFVVWSRDAGTNIYAATVGQDFQ